MTRLKRKRYEHIILMCFVETIVSKTRRISIAKKKNSLTLRKICKRDYELREILNTDTTSELADGKLDGSKGSRYSEDGRSWGASGLTCRAVRPARGPVKLHQLSSVLQLVHGDVHCTSTGVHDDVARTWNR